MLQILHSCSELCPPLVTAGSVSLWESCLLLFTFEFLEFCSKCLKHNSSLRLITSLVLSLHLAPSLNYANTRFVYRRKKPKIILPKGSVASSLSLFPSEETSASRILCCQQQEQLWASSAQAASAAYKLMVCACFLHRGLSFLE